MAAGTKVIISRELLAMNGWNANTLTGFTVVNTEVGEYFAVLEFNKTLSALEKTTLSTNLTGKNTIYNEIV